MAGIKEAMERVMKKCSKGRVVATGVFCTECECGTEFKADCPTCKKTRYVIIHLDDGGMITQYDYGSDLHIHPDVESGSRVMLIINDNWNATWTPITEDHPREDQLKDLLAFVPNWNEIKGKFEEITDPERAKNFIKGALQTALDKVESWEPGGEDGNTADSKDSE